MISKKVIFFSGLQVWVKLHSCWLYIFSSDYHPVRKQAQMGPQVRRFLAAHVVCIYRQPWIRNIATTSPQYTYHRKYTFSLDFPFAAFSSPSVLKPNLHLKKKKRNKVVVYSQSDSKLIAYTVYKFR